MLSPDTLAKIRNDITNKVTQEQIAKTYGISRSLISDIATGRAYKESSGKFDPTNDRILELESEVQLLKEEARLAETKIKARAKTAGLFQAIAEEMEKRIVPLKPLPCIYKPGKKKIVEDVVAHLSDGHHDAIIRPEQVGNLEKHDFHISCARAEQYVDTLLDFTQRTLTNYSFPTLTVLAYGDFTSGEIHNAKERSQYCNMFDNCYAIGQLHSLMFRDLAAHFEQVNVLYLSGNHGRRSVKKDFHGPHDNWDYEIALAAKLNCKDVPNVHFTIPDAWSANVVINGIGFNVSHGDDVHSNSGIPWYGMVRRQKGLIALNSFQGGPRIRYFCMGHHHAASSLSDVDGELLVNGSWIGTDPFAYNALAGYREPCQWLHGVHAKYGITWRLGMKLRRDIEVPKRYIIP